MQRGWNAKGLLTPVYAKVGGVDELARLTGTPRSSLSSRNSGRLNLGIDLAERIVAAVPGVSLLDLGCPQPPSSDVGLLRDRLSQLEELADEIHGNQETETAWLASLDKRSEDVHRSVLALESGINTRLDALDALVRRLGGA